MSLNIIIKLVGRRKRKKNNFDIFEKKQILIYNDGLLIVLIEKQKLKNRRNKKFKYNSTVTSKFNSPLKLQFQDYFPLVGNFAKPPTQTPKL